MNKIVLWGLAVIGLSAVNQTFSWTWNLANWSSQHIIARGEYLSWLCKNDADQGLHPGETKTFNAKECLMTAITGHGPYGYIKPYKSSGQRTYNGFYVLSLNGTLTVFRKDNDQYSR